MIELALQAAYVLGLVLFSLWIVSILSGKVSFIDAFWGMGFVVVAWVMFANRGIDGHVQTLTLALVTLWGLRLSLYLLTRFLGHGEDKRYEAMVGNRRGANRHLFTLLVVFGFQGLLILLISAPTLSAFAAPARDLSTISYIGIALWVVGFVFEAVGDWQLATFKANPANAGKVLDTGLWAWTRHPNYFGDACVWWGIWLIGHDVTVVFAPIIITFLLMKWSGVPMLEATISKRRPGYETYKQRTSSFFPRPPQSA